MGGAAVTEIITLAPEPTDTAWQALTTGQRMRKRYAAQRSIFGVKANGTLTKAGRQNAYLWICGYLQGSHDELDIRWDQNPVYMLCHARGPDFAMGLTDTGEARP